MILEKGPARVPRVLKYQGTQDVRDVKGRSVLTKKGSVEQEDVWTYEKEWMNQEGRVVVEAERGIQPALRVDQVLVWRDLREAYECVRANKSHWRLWRRIRCIFLD